MLFVCTLLTATLVIPVMFEMVTLAAVVPVRVSPPDDVTVIVTGPEAGTVLGLRLICGVAANRPTCRNAVCRNAGSGCMVLNATLPSRTNGSPLAALGPGDSWLRWTVRRARSLMRVSPETSPSDGGSFTGSSS
jgi:hypothetical protein